MWQPREGFSGLLALPGFYPSLEARGPSLHPFVPVEGPSTASIIRAPNTSLPSGPHGPGFCVKAPESAIPTRLDVNPLRSQGVPSSPACLLLSPPSTALCCLASTRCLLLWHTLSSQPYLLPDKLIGSAFIPLHSLP